MYIYIHNVYIYIYMHLGSGIVPPSGITQRRHPHRHPPKPSGVDVFVTQNAASRCGNHREMIWLIMKNLAYEK